MSSRLSGNRPGQNNHPYTQEVLAIDRVSRVVKGGRRFRFRALVVIGDGQGLVGLGLSKGADVSLAVNKAAAVAQRQMFQAIIDETTIPHEVIAHVGGARVLLKPAKEGTGLIAGSVSRTILAVAGYNDIYSKSLGNSNKVNRAYATIEALKKLVGRDQWPEWTQPKSTPAKADLEVAK